MAASVFLHHVVGDLTLGKPELVEFHESETVEAAIRAIGDCSEGAVAVWRKRAAVHQHLGHQQQLQPPSPAQSAEEPRVARFVGMLSSVDVVAFLARTGDHERALRTPVSEVVTPDSSLLKEVDPGTRLIDALEMMKQGVRRLLVRKSVAWRGMSKRFSILYNGKWLKNQDPSSVTGSGSSHPSFSSRENIKFCCLSREDVVRFLIGRLGALAPLPLSPISALGAISAHYAQINASSPALECSRKIPQDPCVVAVVETNPDGAHKIIGEISAYKLQKCDYLAAAWGIANCSAGQFILGFEDNTTMLGSRLDFAPSSPQEDGGAGVASRSKRFSSRSIGFFSGQVNPLSVGGLRSMYRGRSTPLMCKNTSSLAAVMAQMLSHRATHVWVTDANSDDALVGIVCYTDILNAVTRNPSATASSSSS
ncbi:hypothetical protein Taro_020966 [Colocasia esculenta]|uniref:CBS domain-containing protein n=1 Tax=Colocasia esculenta TaxID=4460 RepID=A0A843UXR3_COLES|nr:hypothetical protein [Colocasia esculenta]